MENKQYYDDQMIKQIDYDLKKRYVDEAYKKIQAYMKEYPDDNIIYLYYAKYLSLTNHRESAINMAKKYINTKFGKYKNEVSAYTIYGDIMLDNGYQDEAIEAYKHALSLSPEVKTVSKARIKLINNYINTYRFEEALSLCNVHDDFNNILIKKAEIYSGLKDYKKVIEALDSIKMERIPNEFMLQEINYLYGDAYLKIDGPEKNIDKAIEYLNKACAIKKDYIYAKALSNLGYIHLSKGEYRLAINKAKTIISNTNNAYYGYELLISIYTELRQFDLVKENINQIKNGHRRNQKLFEFNYYNRDFGEAEKNICVVLNDDLEHEHKDNLINYACTLFRLGKYDTLNSLFGYIMDDLDISNDYIDYIKACIGLTEPNSYLTEQAKAFDSNRTIEYLNNKAYTQDILSKYGYSSNQTSALLISLSDLISKQKPIPYGIYDSYYIDELNSYVLTLPGSKKILTIYPNNYEDKDMNIKSLEK